MFGEHDALPGEYQQELQRQRDEAWTTRAALYRELRRAMLRVPGAASARHAFPCATLCLACGWLAFPTDRDPLRSAMGEGTQPAFTCPRCCSEVWADFGVIANGIVVRDFEDHEIARRAGKPRAALGVVGSLVANGVLALGVLGLEPLWTLIAAGVTTAFGAVRGRTLWRALRSPPPRAMRWRAPAPRAAFEPTQLVREGTADGELRPAPISGREVIAWRVEVRLPGERGESLALLEQDTFGLTVDGALVEPAPVVGTHAQLVRTGSQRSFQWLQARGLDPAHEFEIVERVVARGDRLALHRDGLGDTVLVEAEG
ncbi:MAG: hypothetical protein KBB21_30455 [Nannocystaceae bacterium]|nr:hypothetical protein [Nannocystaceae bacterium]